jgi:small subunit ribosomal protein S2
VDTNSNPELLDYPIPANDDGLKSVSLILSKLAECVAEGKASVQYQIPADEQEKAKQGEEAAPAEEQPDTENEVKKTPDRKKAKEKKTEEEPKKNEA